MISSDLDDAAMWWSANRLRYNGIVVVAGAISFLLYVLVAAGMPNVEVTAFTVAFQAIAAGLYLLAANAAYSLGPVIERNVCPSDVDWFRSTMFSIGIGVTVAPFAAVLMLLIYGRSAGA